ncbi:MAG: hypothetical protein OXG74_00230 [Acidobacteria bacterium]|nr:hypothetical protein [Acidobacteriota bacterium]
MRKRRPFFLVGCLVFLFVSALPALGQDEVEVLTNADVVRLTESGLPASVIVAKIETSWTDFDTSVDALVALSEAKVDPAVLEAMTNAGAEPAPAASDSATLDVAAGTRASQVANVASNFEGTPCESPGIFLSEEGSLADLELTQPTSTKTGSGVLSGLTYGIKSTKAKAMIHGARSQVRTSERQPTFYFCFEEAQAGLSYQTAGAVNPSEFVLIAFDVLKKKDQRSFVTGKLNLWTGASGGSPPKQLRQVEYRKVVPGVYEVTAQRLQPGEYAFYYGGQATAVIGLFGPAIGGGASGKVFAFGVD